MCECAAILTASALARIETNAAGRLTRQDFKEGIKLISAVEEVASFRPPPAIAIDYIIAL